MNKLTLTIVSNGLKKVIIFNNIFTIIKDKIRSVVIAEIKGGNVRM